MIKRFKKMKYYDILVLGGGASGVVAAIKACEKGNQVAIIDKANKIAKKILVTGNGRCNLTNLNTTEKQYNVDISQFLNRFGVNDTLYFFDSIGLVTYADEEGRVYPLSNSAKSVMDVLTNKLSAQNIDCFLEHNILKVEKWDDNFLVKTDKDEFLCKKVIVSLGGNFTTQILDIKGINFIPSLVSLKANISRNLSGCRISDAVVCVEDLHGNKMTERGEVLFKEKGISGICIFNLSSLFARNKKFEGKLRIDLMPNYTDDMLLEMLQKRRSLNVKVNKFFDGLLLSQIGYEILNRIKLDEEKSSLNLTEAEIKQMASLIKNLDYDITGCLDNNQIFAGGIDLAQLTPNLEHKTIKNLYFTGEACNVDGLCGGYNLQWAWTSGYIVGENI